MEITLITIGKTTTSYLREGIATYLKRLTHYTSFSILEIPDVKKGSSISDDRQKDLEGDAILSRLQNSDFVTLLDERGRLLTSREFAAAIERHLAAGRRRVVFVVGGPYGFSKAVYDRADSLLSLSKMTFSHEMVRLFFTEQLYRAFTIIRGEPYHHD